MLRESFLGVLMLATRFPRPPGDIGHPSTFGFPVRRVVVPGASPQRVVRERAEGLLRPFVEAAQALVDEGAAAITTSCGFLVLFQAALQRALPVPVWTSSLLALPELAGQAPGVITADAAALTPEHLRCAGLDAATVATVPVEGLPTAAEGGHLQGVLLNDRPALDASRAEADVLLAARRLRARHPGVRSLVLECTNLPPYADALRSETGLPVHDIVTLLNARWAALRGQ